MIGGERMIGTQNETDKFTLKSQGVSDFNFQAKKVISSKKEL